MFRFFCLVAFCNFILFVFGATQNGFLISEFGLSKFRFSLSFSKSKKPASFPSRLHIFLTCRLGENDGPDNGKMWKGSVSPATLDLLAWSILTAWSNWPLNQKVRKGRKMERNRESIKDALCFDEFMMAFLGRLASILRCNLWSPLPWAMATRATHTPVTPAPCRCRCGFVKSNSL